MRSEKRAKIDVGTTGCLPGLVALHTADQKPPDVRGGKNEPVSDGYVPSAVRPQPGKTLGILWYEHRASHTRGRPKVPSTRYVTVCRRRKPRIAFDHGGCGPKAHGRPQPSAQAFRVPKQDTSL